MMLYINGESINYSLKKQTDHNGVERCYYRAYIAISTDPITNRKQYKEVTAPSEAVFRQKIDALQCMRPLSYSTPVSLETYMKHWLTLQKLHYKPTVSVDYEKRLENLVYPSIGMYLLTEVTDDIMFRFYDDLIDQHSLSSARQVYAILNPPLEAAAKDSLRHGNPQAQIRLPKVQKKPIRPLSAAECRQLKKLCEADPLCGNAVLLTLMTGMRISECVGLAADDYDPVSKSLCIHRQINDSKIGYVLQDTTKNRKARVLYLSDGAANLIEKQLAQMERYKEEAGSGWNNRYNCLFTIESGDFIKHFILRASLREKCSVIGRNDFSFHHLRHPYVKHTTKKYICKSRNPKLPFQMIVWDFCSLGNIFLCRFTVSRLA